MSSQERVFIGEWEGEKQDEEEVIRFQSELNINLLYSFLINCRASQKHHVPRKTLRNWMKRCQIKSAYPMPSQLKEAAEKKKMQKFDIQAFAELA